MKKMKRKKGRIIIQLRDKLSLECMQEPSKINEFLEIVERTVKEKPELFETLMKFCRDRGCNMSAMSMPCGM
jgi:hypothetical protein